MNLTRRALYRVLIATGISFGCLGGSPRSWAGPTAVPADQLGHNTTEPTNSLEDRGSDDRPLPTDPANIHGQFANGLHYVIRKNVQPPGKVYLDLAVRTGSLNESDEQNGLAHFLEHMAFKGSAHYEPTRLIPMLQHLGMRFGADANAYTNHCETVFKLTMPDNQPQTLDTALTIFSDYASGLSLFPIQIESERRVILEEMRARMNAGRREQQEEYKLLFPGSRLAIHDVLGDTDILKSAQQPLFLDYWNKWYRPEKMTLVIVGDVDPATIIAQAKPLLGNFKARAPAQPAASAGLEPFDSAQAVVISDPEQVTGDVELVNLRPVRPPITTAAQYRDKLIERVALAIVNRHFSSLASTGRMSFQSARVSAGDMLRDGYLITARAQGDAQDWRKSLEVVILEINRYIENGFRQRDLDEIRDWMIADAKELAKTESTRDSSAMIAATVTSVDTDQPMLSRSQELDLLQRFLPSITTGDLQQTFAADFKNSSYAYVVNLPAASAGHKLPTEDQVLDVADRTWQLPMLSTTQSATTRSATTQTASTAPALPPEPAAGSVASREFDADLGVTNVEFENGVVLHHKFSDYKKDLAMVQIILPGGTLEETTANRGISSVASLIMDRLATSKLSSFDIRTLLADKNVSIDGGISTDSLSINVDGSPGDLPLGLLLVHSILTDPKLEQPAVLNWKKLSVQSLHGKPMLADPQLTDSLASTIMGGDVRFTALTARIVQRQLRIPAQAWFKRIADQSAVEVTIVGDISADDAVLLGAKYLGSLPKRTGAFADLDSLRHIDRAPGPYLRTVHYTSVEPKALVMAGFVGCDESDPQRRPLAMAAATLTDRMIQRIRFDQQLVYSIRCSSNLGRTVPGTGTFAASTFTDPHNADRLADEIIAMIREFAANGPSDDELTVAKKQIANQFVGEMNDPRFWLAQLSELQYHHRSLDDLKKVPGIYQTYTATQIRDAVRKFATDDRLIRIEILPDQLATATEPSTQPANSENQLVH